MELGNKIKQLRIQYGYTQEGLADKVGRPELLALV